MQIAVFDLHCDTLTAPWGEEPGVVSLNHPQAQFSLGKIPPKTPWAQCCAVFLPQNLSPDQAWSRFWQVQKRFGKEAELLGAAPCRDGDDIERAWKAGKPALLLTVENGTLLGDRLERVAQLAEAGVVMLTLTWNGANGIGSGHYTAGGLTDFGRRVIPQLERHGILVDVSHLNARGFWQAVELARRPQVASHSNARACCAHPRNLTDAQIGALMAGDGLMGLNFHTPFLRGDGNPAGLDDLYRHADHCLALGAEKILALGSDFDGANLSPAFDRCDKVLEMGEYLLARGLPQKVVEGILFQNARCFFQTYGISLAHTVGK